MSAIEAEALANPQDWEAGGRVHNWRNYIGAHTRALWDSFTDQQKVALAMDADERASAEDWE